MAIKFNFAPTDAIEAVRAPVDATLERVLNEIAGLPDPSQPLKMQYSLQQQIKQITYPIDLLGSDSYGEYMLFTVNAPVRKVTARKTKQQQVKNSKAPNLVASTNPLRDLQKKATGLVNRVTNAISGIDLQNTISKAAAQTESAVEYHTAIESIITNEIALHMPISGLEANYQPKYNEEEFGLIANVSNLDDLKNAVKTIGEFKGIKDTIDSITGTKLATKKTKEVGRTINPDLEALFDGMSLRTFDFSWDFAPRSEQELVNALAIIKAFKYWSLPGLAESGTQFTFPAHFNIHFMKRGEVKNQALFAIKRCYCTGVKVNYSPDSIWSAFKNGAPVHFTMDVSFMEDGVITRQDIIGKDGVGA